MFARSALARVGCRRTTLCVKKGSFAGWRFEATQEASKSSGVQNESVDNGFSSSEANIVQETEANVNISTTVNTQDIESPGASLGAETEQLKPKIEGVEDAIPTGKDANRVTEAEEKLVNNDAEEKYEINDLTASQEGSDGSLLESVETSGEPPAHIRLQRVPVHANERDVYRIWEGLEGIEPQFVVPLFDNYYNKQRDWVCKFSSVRVAKIALNHAQGLSRGVWFIAATPFKIDRLRGIPRAHVGRNASKHVVVENFPEEWKIPDIVDAFEEEQGVPGALPIIKINMLNNQSFSELFPGASPCKFKARALILFASDIDASVFYTLMHNRVFKDDNGVDYALNVRMLM